MMPAKAAVTERPDPWPLARRGKDCAGHPRWQWGDVLAPRRRCCGSVCSHRPSHPRAPQARHWAPRRGRPVPRGQHRAWAWHPGPWALHLGRPGPGVSHSFDPGPSRSTSSCQPCPGPWRHLASCSSRSISIEPIPHVPTAHLLFFEPALPHYLVHYLLKPHRWLGARCEDRMLGRPPASYQTTTLLPIRARSRMGNPHQGLSPAHLPGVPQPPGRSAPLLSPSPLSLAKSIARFLT